MAIDRPSARVLLLDPSDRLLLFRNVEPEHSTPDFWIAPGGRVEAGESFEAAALRELREETGFAPVSLGPCVWRRRASFRFRDTAYDGDDRFFLLRVPAAFVPSFVALTATERDTIRESHWWSVDEVMAASDTLFAPRGLGALFGALLIKPLPAQPIETGE